MDPSLANTLAFLSLSCMLVATVGLGLSLFRSSNERANYDSQG